MPSRVTVTLCVSMAVAEGKSIFCPEDLAIFRIVIFTIDFAF